MDQSRFWQIIEKAGNGDETESLIEVLRCLTPMEIIEFDLQFQRHLDAAYKADLSAAAVLLNGGSCGDDCFYGFRCWLISRGQRVYEAALTDPDTLADKAVDIEDSRPITQLEVYRLSPVDAFKAVTGKDMDSVMAAENIVQKYEEHEPIDWQRYSNDVMAATLPKLWEKYGHHKLRFDEEIQQLGPGPSISKVVVPGLGEIVEGTKVRHMKFGKGTIKKITDESPAIALIEFESEEPRHIMLSPDWLRITQ